MEGGGGREGGRGRYVELNENLPLMDQASLLTDLYNLFRNRNVIDG